MNPYKPLPRLFCVLAFQILGFASASASVISVGPQTITVPAYFGSVTLGADQFLVPINASGVVGLQDWRFDFSFDPSVVVQIEPFFTPYSLGLYAAQFDLNDPNSLSSPTSAGFSIAPGLIEEISGFSLGATGDGPLVFLAFEYLQPNGNPDFAVSNVAVTQAVPEPDTLAMVAAALAGLAFIRRTAKARPSTLVRNAKENQHVH